MQLNQDVVNTLASVREVIEAATADGSLVLEPELDLAATIRNIETTVKFLDAKGLKAQETDIEQLKKLNPVKIGYVRELLANINVESFHQMAATSDATGTCNLEKLLKAMHLGKLVLEPVVDLEAQQRNVTLINNFFNAESFLA